VDWNLVCLLNLLGPVILTGKNIVEDVNPV